MSEDENVYRITNAQQPRSIDRDFRQRRYLISMIIRTVCFLGAVVVSGPFRWVLVFLAVVLPYVSVVLANSPTNERKDHVMPPLIIRDTSELPSSHPDRT